MKFHMNREDRIALLQGAALMACVIVLGAIAWGIGMGLAPAVADWVHSTIGEAHNP